MVAGKIEYDQNTKIVSRKGEAFDEPPGGIGVQVFQKMKEHGEKIAQISARTGEKETYSSLLQKCIRTALKMKDLGVKPGDIISICSHNHLNNVVPHLAAQFLGAITANTDPTISAQDTEYLLSLVKPKMMFIDEASEQMIPNVLQKLGHKCEIITFGNGDKFMNFSKFIEPRDDETKFKPYFVEDGNQTALIFFSSGTTGFPKGICLSHNFYLFNVFTTREWSDMKVLLGYATLYWTSSNLIILSAITFGTTRLICDRFDANEFWTYVDKYQVDAIFMAPSQGILCIKNKPKEMKHKIKNYFLGGAPLSTTYLQQIMDALPGTHVTRTYGATEIGNVSTFTADEMKLYKHKPDCSGRPMEGMAIKIVDPETEEVLGFNESGEIRIKCTYMLNGYHNQDSSACWDKEGFFKTGDIGFCDEDFCLFIMDRIKEMFKYQSWHIVPAKLEAILETHSAVNVAAVVGIPHLEDDNHALGVVVLNKGVTATAKELEEYVNELVDERHKLYAGVRIVESLPYTPTGKIKRRVLRDMFKN